jgi:hypothetical protein
VKTLLYAVTDIDSGEVVGYFTAPESVSPDEFRQTLTDQELTVESVGDTHQYTTPDALVTLFRRPAAMRPCRNCDTLTDHPWGVCPKCFRDPATNNCEECGDHSPGIPYVPQTKGHWEPQIHFKGKWGSFYDDPNEKVFATEGAAWACARRCYPDTEHLSAMVRVVFVPE